jgi:hypothetical protein
VLCVPPIVYYLFAMHLIFILPSSHSDNEEKKTPQPHLHENPQRGADDKPKTASESDHFLKEDMNSFDCALLFTVFMLCILLYRIGSGGNKLFLFVFVFVS